jgi:hypothetical protein
VASSGMEAPHLKQNIHTSLGFRPVVNIFGFTQSEKYFIHIEKAITSRIRGIIFSNAFDRYPREAALGKGLERCFSGKVSAHPMDARGGWS